MQAMEKISFLCTATLFAAFMTAIPCLSAQPESKKYRGVDFILETGGFAGADRFQTTGYSPLSFVAGYTFNEHWFLGAGAEFLVYPHYEWGSIPVLVRLKATILKSKISPYAQLDIGCNIPAFPAPTCVFYQGKPGPLLVRPEIGVAMRMRNRQAIHMGVGLMINDGEYSTPRIIPSGHTEANCSFAISFKAGYTF